jgi:hypothetical protein
MRYTSKQTYVVDVVVELMPARSQESRRVAVDIKKRVLCNRNRDFVREKEGESNVTQQT